MPILLASETRLGCANVMMVEYMQYGPICEWSSISSYIFAHIFHTSWHASTLVWPQLWSWKKTLKEDIKSAWKNITRHQKTSKGIKKIERHRKALKGMKRHGKASEGIERHRKAFKGMERHWKASKGIEWHQKASKVIERHRKASRGTKRHQKVLVLKNSPLRSH